MPMTQQVRGYEMRKQRMGVAAVLAFLASGWMPPAHAAVPALGSGEGELLCAGWTNVLASGSLLSTGRGGDTLTAVKAHGVFLGRLSVIAPEARYRLRDFYERYDKMTAAEQNELADSCLAKLKEINVIGGAGPEPSVR